jgi:hypothetical protein
MKAEVTDSHTTATYTRTAYGFFLTGFESRKVLIPDRSAMEEHSHGIRNLCKPSNLINILLLDLLSTDHQIVIITGKEISDACFRSWLTIHFAGRL